MHAPTSTELFATVVFGIAVLHTFLVKRFEHLAKRFREGSVGENLMHLLAEVEVVFGLWSSVLLVGTTALQGWGVAREYLDGRNFGEPIFVVAILVMASSAPIMSLARRVLRLVARLIPLKEQVATFFVILTAGPLLGSLITEPAAMTLTALLLKARFFDGPLPARGRYLALGTLFVNVSIGGVLTSFAAPPVLMVVDRFHWTTGFMITHMGWKAALAVALNTAALTAVLYRDLVALPSPTAGGEAPTTAQPIPVWVSLVHVGFLALVVANVHHPALVVGALLFFVGWVSASREYQEPLRLREGLMVGFFLGGLVTLGGMQEWWIRRALHQLPALPLFLGATGLTAITDNAALTYLGSLAPLTYLQKIALVTGSVTGGGLTVIANAPNPAGYGILRDSFGDEGISPLGLFLGASIPTIIAALVMYLIPW